MQSLKRTERNTHRLLTVSERERQCKYKQKQGAQLSLGNYAGAKKSDDALRNRHVNYANYLLTIAM